MAKSRIPPLDGLRGLAVLLVFGLHLSYGHLPGGFVGVGLFFTLSGYLITGVLLRDGRLGHFYRRRAQRLLPALGVAIVLAGMTWSIACPGFAFGRAVVPTVLYVTNIVAMLGGAQAMGLLLPTWSLANEEQFYLTWPFVLRAIRRLGPKAWTVPVGIAVVADAARALLPLSYFSPLTYADWILFGCALALAPRKPRVPWLAWATVAALAVVALRVDPTAVAYFRWCSPLLALGACALIVEATNATSVLARLLSARPLVWLGQRSYGVYLYQLAIISAFEPFRHAHDAANFVGITALRVAVTFLVADLSFRWIERPVLAWAPAAVASPELPTTAE